MYALLQVIWRESAARSSSWVVMVFRVYQFGSLSFLNGPLIFWEPKFVLSHIFPHQVDLVPEGPYITLSVTQKKLKEAPLDTVLRGRADIPWSRLIRTDKTVSFSLKPRWCRCNVDSLLTFSHLLWLDFLWVHIEFSSESQPSQIGQLDSITGDLCENGGGRKRVSLLKSLNGNSDVANKWLINTCLFFVGMIKSGISGVLEMERVIFEVNSKICWLMSNWNCFNDQVRWKSIIYILPN